MTIIAYRDGVIAADTWITAGDAVVGEVTKIISNERGMWGASGHLGDLGKFHEWAAKPDPDFFDKLEFESFFGLFIDKDGGVNYFDHTSKGVGTPIMADYFAVGGAQDFALGAMAAGASAVQAVKATAKTCMAIGGHVESLSLDREYRRERLEK